MAKPRGARTKRDVDWVVNPGAWLNTSSVPVILNTIAGFPSEICLLTLPPAINATAGDLRTAYFMEDVTAVRIRGSIHITEAEPTDPILDVNLWTFIDLRIIKATVDPETGAWTPATFYQLEEAGVANESFLWHKTITQREVDTSEWFAVGKQRVPWTWDLDVDVGVMRRLEPNDVLLLVGQARQMSTAPYDTLTKRYNVVPRLRTLLKES